MLEIRAAHHEATMDLPEDHSSYHRFEAYIEQLIGVIGHADRAVPLHDYCTGLLLPGERKSVEPMAALTAPARTAPKHQSLLHFVANAPWSDEAVLTKVRQMVLPKIQALGAIEASIIDDTGFPKKGKHSVGVARQYCGQLGKQDNCQAVVSLSLANHQASLPIAHRLYLPETWANDPVRRKQAKIPNDVVFRTKPQIALEQIRTAQAAGIPLGTVLADAGYGYDSHFRAGVTALGLPYAVGIQSNVLIWKADAILPMPGVDGQKPSRPQRREQQLSAKELALNQPAEAWQMITWREHGEAFTSRFTRLRVRRATCRGVAADRMAAGRGGADQILAVHLAGRYQLRGAGRSRQTALADRTRLPGTQTGSRPGPLRRTRLARVTPSHNPLHRGLRVPDRRTGDFSPLRTQARSPTHDGCHFRPSPIRRRLRCVHTGISPTPSPRSGGG
jgi:SRSO17 transposase